MWSRLRTSFRRPTVWLPVAALTAVGLLILLLGPVAWWATPAKHLQGKDKADARNATRQVLLAAVGGLVLLTGAGFTARTYFLTRRGQLTDRYTKAIALLASDKLTERLGGIYALEHLMVESDRDHSTVVDVLAAFIREQARDLPAEPDDYISALGEPLRTDIQAALTVLGRRPERPEPHRIDLSRAELRRADLSGARFTNATFFRTDLRAANLEGANLQGAELFRTRLARAWLTRTNVQHAYLGDADLEGATLTGARLQRAHVCNAILKRADLSEADLDGARVTTATMEGASLTGARLCGVDLSRATGLTPAQVREAILDEHTVLPPDLRAALDAGAGPESAT